MASTTISVNDQAYKLLKKARAKGQSFSDVIIDYVQPPAKTFGELLDRLEEMPPPPIDRELMAKVRAGRGRPSQRKAR
jgi:predicted CopG family antitoxin